jgi:hypothetical protein
MVPGMLCACFNKFSTNIFRFFRGICVKMYIRRYTFYLSVNMRYVRAHVCICALAHDCNIFGITMCKLNPFN